MIALQTRDWDPSEDAAVTSKYELDGEKLTQGDEVHPQAVQTVEVAVRALTIRVQFSEAIRFEFGDIDAIGVAAAEMLTDQLIDCMKGIG